MPALRRLFHRSGSGAVLRTRAHVVSLPVAGLLQWTQLSSPTVKPAPDRVSCAGQRLRLDCRLGAGPEVSGPLLGENGAPQAGPVRRPVLPGGLVQQFRLSYHWNLDQVEFATDIVFAKQV